MMEDVILDLQNVNKRYHEGTAREVHAVKDLNMAINRGEIIALLGSSGCGKTSTLRMVAGFESASQGQMLLAGRSINRLPPAQRGVAMAFEGYSLYPPMTLRENISFALKAQRLPASDIENRVGEVAALLEIEDFLDRYPGSVSGGQQQRASLARALVRQADLHLLDEPMGQLEPRLRALLRGRIKHFIKSKGYTAILVTHDQTEANALADRIAVMENGELLQYDPPEKLREQPANLFTGTFIGEPPMNIFKVGIKRHQHEIIMQLADDQQLQFNTSAWQSEVAEGVPASGELVLGIRPHSLALADNDAGNRIAASVVANQWLGDQSHLALEICEQTCVAVTHTRHQAKRGDKVFIQFDPDHIHLFDPANGRALAHGLAGHHTHGGGHDA